MDLDLGNEEHSIIGEEVLVVNRIQNAMKVRDLIY